MKKAGLFIMMILILSGTSCTSKETQTSPTTASAFDTVDIRADEILIFHMPSSFLLTLDDEDTMKELLNSFNALSFKPSENEIDVISIYQIVFIDQDEVTGGVLMDKNGICWVKGKSGACQIASGTFSYERVAEIFEKGQQDQLHSSEGP